mmetsp:Transcript_4656/g.12941  ORF Transcript_4656/g.12941 Transcript_4656/m.12941 type:complete len:213 (-) Transcript_4656:1790-2428(-)
MLTTQDWLDRVLLTHRESPFQSLNYALRKKIVGDLHAPLAHVLMQLADALLHRALECEALDNNLLRLPEAMNAPRRLRFHRRVKRWFHEVDAGCCGERDTHIAHLERDHKHFRLSLDRSGRLELANKICAPVGRDSAVEAVDGEALCPEGMGCGLAHELVLREDNCMHARLTPAQLHHIIHKSAKLGACRRGEEQAGPISVVPREVHILGGC